MAARNRIVNAGGGASNGITQGVNDQSVAVFQGLTQLVGVYVEDTQNLPNQTLGTPTWYKVEYV